MKFPELSFIAVEVLTYLNDGEKHKTGEIRRALIERGIKRDRSSMYQLLDRMHTQELIGKQTAPGAYSEE